MSIGRFNPQLVRTPVSCEAEAQMEWNPEGEYVNHADHIAAMAEAGRIIEQCLKLIENEREVLERSFLPEPSETEAELLTAYEEATVAAKAFLEANR